MAEHLPECQTGRSQWIPGPSGRDGLHGFLQMPLPDICAPECPVRAAERARMFSTDANARAGLEYIRQRYGSSAATSIVERARAAQKRLQ